VIQVLSRDKRKEIAEEISLGSPMRPIGCIASEAFRATSEDVIFAYTFEVFFKALTSQRKKTNSIWVG
jgi:hypothetical protein